MKGMLKVKYEKKCNCKICGETLKRVKTFRVVTDEKNIESAKLKLVEKSQNWKLTLKQQHCSICWSIVLNVKKNMDAIKF